MKVRGHRERGGQHPLRADGNVDFLIPPDCLLFLRPSHWQIQNSPRLFVSSVVLPRSGQLMVKQQLGGKPTSPTLAQHRAVAWPSSLGHMVRWKNKSVTFISGVYSGHYGRGGHLDTGSTGQWLGDRWSVGHWPGARGPPDNKRLLFSQPLFCSDKGHLLFSVCIDSSHRWMSTTQPIYIHQLTYRSRPKYPPPPDMSEAQIHCPPPPPIFQKWRFTAQWFRQVISARVSRWCNDTCKINTTKW